ncbi:MAG: aldehyde dehydrogenase [Flavobacteriaceae bacterium]|nr:aldehyde dehydrogenase [Flavobacteriaceae bacterium]
MNISSLLQQQREFFKTQATKDISFRIQHIENLKRELISKEQDIYKALHQDFNKSEFESFMSEYGIAISEINLVLKHLKKWAKPERIKSSMLTFPSKDYIYKEPYGTVLVIAPWNYPFLLAIEPLVMAIAAGNTVVLKPSELTNHTSKLISNIIEKVFDKAYVCSVQGGVSVAAELLEQKWDYIFFTGSVPVGKIVAKAAAEHLTPVTLELGGKSPCIIDDTANLKLTAKRLVWGKLFNAGQTCIAPDYVIAKSSIKSELIENIKFEIEAAYTANPHESEDYPRIINHKNLLRLAKMLENVNVVYGGSYNEEDCYFSPTIIDEPSLDSNVMQDEIFGPILPILNYDTEADIFKIINHFDKPLSLYVFSNQNKFIDYILHTFSFGGGAINDPLVHFGNHRLPFGGVGASGMGAYHGKLGFDTFSHRKAIVKRGNWIDPPVRYAPYKGKLGVLKKMFKLFS